MNKNNKNNPNNRNSKNIKEIKLSSKKMFTRYWISYTDITFI